MANKYFIDTHPCGGFDIGDTVRIKANGITATVVLTGMTPRASDWTDKYYSVVTYGGQGDHFSLWDRDLELISRKPASLQDGVEEYNDIIAAQDLWEGQ